MSKLKKYIIGNIYIDIHTDDELLTIIHETIESKKRISIAHANSHFITEAEHNSQYYNDLRKYTIIQPDGIGIYYALRFLYTNRTIKSVQTGTDFYFKLLNYANDLQRRIFFIGTTDDVLNYLEKVICNNYPSIVIAGMQNGYFDHSNKKIIDDINRTKPDIILVGMGVPLQERWLQANIEVLNSSVSITVGAGLEFIAQKKKRAPSFLRKIGLEWFFRLVQEPRRLWKRYIIGIPIFVYIILRQKLFKSLL